MPTIDAAVGDQTQFLVLYSKLKGIAAELINSRKRNSWDEINNHFESRFGVDVSNPRSSKITPQRNSFNFCFSFPKLRNLTVHQNQDQTLVEQLNIIRNRNFISESL